MVEQQGELEMRTSINGSVLLAGVCMMAATVASGQETSAKRLNAAFDVAITYDASRANVIAGNSFWMQGASIQMHGQFWHGLGAVADVASLHTASMNTSGVGLDMVTATFGPRYTWSPLHARYSLFGQASAGEAHGFNSTFPGTPQAVTTASSVVEQLGGGMNVSLKRHLALRVFEADWLRTQLPNSTTSVQNNLKLGAGVVLRFK
jgi:hypothetical protein